MLKHDVFVKELESLIAKDYDSILTHLTITDTDSGRQVGEVDLLARKGDMIDVFEVKCSFRKTKAKKQLKRIRKRMKVRDTYWYVGSSGMLEKLIL